MIPEELQERLLNIFSEEDLNYLYELALIHKKYISSNKLTEEENHNASYVCNILNDRLPLLF